MNMELPPLQDIATFIAVARHGSFTRAAEQLGTSKSSVGKAVQRLETRLGTKLFQRTTRAVRLTEDGQIFLEAARAAIDGLADAESVLAARRGEPVGQVRIDIAASLGMALMPGLRDLRRRHPKITLELSLNDRHSDPVKDGWDIVVRIGPLSASGDMTVRKLCELRSGLFASPRYLDGRPTIRTIDDLRGQEGVLYRTNAGLLRPWLIRDGDGTVELVPAATVVAHDGRTLVEAIRAGLGVGQLFDRVAAPFVTAGELVPVLPQHNVLALPVHALLPVGRHMPPRTRVVLDHLAEALRAPV